jgi:hypothetical protein
MTDLKFLGRMGITMTLAGMVCLAADTAGAIDVDLNAAAVKKAVEDGKQMKDEEIKVSPTRFGANLKEDLCGGGGEIQTKTVSLNRFGAMIAARPEDAERDKDKVNESIQKLAESKRFKIVFDFCGDTPDFAEGSSATLEQEGRMIKGEIGKPDRAKKNEKGPAYRGKIAAYWNYGSFNPKAVTKITLFPPMGDAMTWEVDFSKIK